MIGIDVTWYRNIYLFTILYVYEYAFMKFKSITHFIVESVYSITNSIYSNSIKMLKIRNFKHFIFIGFILNIIISFFFFNKNIYMMLMLMLNT